MSQQQGGSWKEVRVPLTKTEFGPDVCSLYLVGVAANLCKNGYYCPAWCGIRSVVNGLVSDCQKWGGKLTTIRFPYSHAFIAEACFWNFWRAFFDEPVSLLMYGSRGSSDHTLTSKSALLRHFWHEGTLLFFFVQHSYLEHRGCSDFMNTESRSCVHYIVLRTYLFFAARVLWCGHIDKGFGRIENVSTDGMAANRWHLHSATV